VNAYLSATERGKNKTEGGWGRKKRRILKLTPQRREKESGKLGQKGQCGGGTKKKGGGGLK